MKPRRRLTNTQLSELAMCLENDGDFHREFTTLVSASGAYSLISEFARKLMSDGLLNFSTREGDQERELLRAHLAENWGVCQELDSYSRAHIDDRYKDFYHRPDDYDPDNVKVHKGSAVGPSTAVKDFSDPVFEWRDVSPTGRMGGASPEWQEFPKPRTAYRTELADEFRCDLVGIEKAIAYAAQFLNPEIKPAATCGTNQTESNTMTKIITIRTVTTVSTEAQDNGVVTYVNGTDIKSKTDAEVYTLIAEQEAHIETLSKIQNKPMQLVVELDKRKAGVAALVKVLDDRYIAANPGAVLPTAAKPKAARKAPVKAAETATPSA